ncbi:MarR family transcriptional regulator [Formicincola oecophyllae]|uniref:MarR family transcriptional regulator n=1 Tax=Formicincola oecophyllae TaxID=2558361 RepID=A0A4Y6UBJ1_9PROT|nr:MarR family transcriptional regulator [Formicincola oecophyllae]QDH13938.1 MarR family transcriptional regulator [Formicincola oecophyllae]
MTKPRDPHHNDRLAVLRETMVSLVRGETPDLSARQMAVFLTCYVRDGAHTVRGLAQALNVSKPAITRALDRLAALGLALRKEDPMDRRSVLVQRTPKGAAYLRRLRQIMRCADHEGDGRDHPTHGLVALGMGGTLGMLQAG